MEPPETNFIPTKSLSSKSVSRVSTAYTTNSLKCSFWEDNNLELSAVPAHFRSMSLLFLEKLL